MLRFFEGENTDDLDERFDEIARDPQEFLGWLLVATTRTPLGDKFNLAVEVAVALYGYIVGGDFDDDAIAEAADRVAAVIEEGGRRGRLHRSPNAAGHDASSPFAFFASRATDDVRDAAEVNAP